MKRASKPVSSDTSTGTIKERRGPIMSKAVFYHIGCPVCVNAEELIVGLLDRPRCDPEVVNI
jgi:hypothetical protein